MRPPGPHRRPSGPDGPEGQSRFGHRHVPRARRGPVERRAGYRTFRPAPAGRERQVTPPDTTVLTTADATATAAGRVISTVARRAERADDDTACLCLAV